MVCSSLRCRRHNTSSIQEDQVPIHQQMGCQTDHLRLEQRRARLRQHHTHFPILREQRQLGYRRLVCHWREILPTNLLEAYTPYSSPHHQQRSTKPLNKLPTTKCTISHWANQKPRGGSGCFPVFPTTLGHTLTNCNTIYRNEILPPNYLSKINFAFFEIFLVP